MTIVALARVQFALTDKGLDKGTSEAIIAMLVIQCIQKAKHGFSVFFVFQVLKG